jgi:flagellar protein FlbT
MNITLRAGERLYLNGAVIKLDRKATIELLNDAAFLLENHVIQASDATTPLRQIYFVVQVMLMDPSAARATNELVHSRRRKSGLGSRISWARSRGRVTSRR